MKKALVSLFLIVILPVFIFAEIKIDPYEWNLGIVSSDQVYRTSIAVKNEGTQGVSVSLMSTCSCLTVSESVWELKPGEIRSVELAYDTVDDCGDFEKIIIVRTSDPSLSKGFFPVYGRVDGEPEGTGLTAPASDYSSYPEEKGTGLFDYYFDPGCRSCHKFLEEDVPRLSERLGVEIRLNRKDINQPSIYEELKTLLDLRGIAWDAVPVLVSSGAVLQGDKDILDNLEAVIKGDWVSEESEITPDKEIKGFLGLLFAVLFAGFLDGVNPCAFTTLIFLISALTVAGRSKREILSIGLFFSLAVYLTYFLVGAGFFSLIRAAGSFSLAARIIRWALILVLLIFGILSLVDYGRIRQGRPGEIILQLPGAIKKRIHGTIRTRMRSAALIGSSLVLGFLISLFELGCTGQIYFPTLTYMIQREEGMAGWFLLGIYNLAFIVPLLAVFFSLYMGYGSERLTAAFRNKMGVIKILTALLFFSLAALTFFT